MIALAKIASSDWRRSGNPDATTTRPYRPTAPTPLTQNANLPTVSLGYLSALFDYLRRHDIAPTALPSAQRLDLADRDARISESEGAALFNEAAGLLRDPDLGLHVGEQIRPGHYGGLGYVAMACATLGEVLQYIQRYQALVLSVPTVSMHMEGDAVTLAWPPDLGAAYRHLAEFNLAAIVSFVRWLSGQPALSPLRVDFSHPTPSATDGHTRVFGCPLRFSEAEYRLVIPAHWSGLPLIQSDPTMRAMMDRLAERQLLALAHEGELLGQARRLIAQRLPIGPVDIGGIAGELHVSVRSLQRKLQQRSLSFTQLVDEVRRELAESYLAEPSLDLMDLTLLLGFSEQSAFHRAFRRWTGRTPGEHRRGLGITER